MQFSTPFVNRGLRRPDWQFHLISGSDWPCFNRTRQMLFVCYWNMDIVLKCLRNQPMSTA